MPRISIKLPNIYDSVQLQIMSDQAFRKLADEKFSSQNVLAFCETSTMYIPDSKLSDIPILVHQIIHAVIFILNDKNIKDEEMLCYTVQYVLEKILTYLEKRKNKTIQKSKKVKKKK